MKKIRLRTIVIYALTVLSGAALLHTSQSVQKAEEELAKITRDAAQEEDSIRVLKAEWAYLNSPARLEVLARKYLNLHAPEPGGIVASYNSSASPAKAGALNAEKIPACAGNAVLSSGDFCNGSDDGGTE